MIAPLDYLAFVLVVLAAAILGGVLLHHRRSHHHAQLREAEARIASISESSPVGLFTMDLRGGISYANRACAVILGLAPETLVGAGYRAALHQEDVEAAGVAWREAIRDSLPFDRVIRVTPDEVRWIRVRGEPMRYDGQVVGYVGSVEEVTQQRRAQAALVASATRLRAIFDATADGIIVTDATGAIESLNPAADRLFGYESDELFGRPINTVLDGLPPDGLVSLAAASHSGNGRVVESQGRRRDKSQVPIDLAVSSIEIGGTPTFIATIRDISERKRAEEDRLKHLGELEAAKCSLERTAADLARSMEEIADERARAESATRAKSDFLATMSHEIRTPMNGVIGMAGLLLDTPLSAEQREYATTVKSSAEALLTIINDILDFSKVEAGRLTFEPLPFDLRTAIEETIDLLSGKAAEKGLALAARFAPDTPRHLIGNVGRVRQILMNYAGNAIKFTGTGHVMIEVSCLGRSPTEARLRLAVSDTGIGIPLEHRGRLFRKFSQTDASTTRKYGGTGLGLAICKQLAELMGGEVGLESEIGRGSTFWATISLSLDPAAGEGGGGGGSSPLDPELAGRRLLYVHANPLQRDWEMQLAAELGLRPEAAPAAEAIERLERAAIAHERFDVVIVDHAVTDPPPRELAATITKTNRSAGPWLVLVSDVGTRGEAAALSGAGFNAYLTRPLRPGTLASAVRRRDSSPPLAGQPSTSNDSAMKVAETSDRPARRALLVDDNAVNQKVGAKLLERLGCRVDLAANGLEAVEAWARVPYHVVFMDCQMPEMDGFEATSEIRRRERPGQRTPIVALTANATQGDREKCLAAGMDDYLAKPIRPDELKAVLARWLDRSGATV